MHAVRLRITSKDGAKLRDFAHRNRLDLCFGSIRETKGDYQLDAWLGPADAAGVMVQAMAAPEIAITERRVTARRVTATAAATGAGYLSAAQIEDRLAGLASGFPAICERITLPNLSHEGRTITAIRIGSKPSDQGDVLLITGSAHAREWGGADFCVSLANNLLVAYTNGTGLTWGRKVYTAAEIQRIVDTIQVVILPDVNPDGREWSQKTDRMWRRNRNTAHAGGSAACVGVDLNRNYDFLWDHRKHFHPSAQVGTSADPCDPQQTWRGPGPLSEPETKNVDWLLRRWPRMRWYIDVHSYGELILYPWGDDDSQATDAAMSFTNAAYDGKRGISGDTLYREYLPAADATTNRALATALADGVRAVRGKRYTTQPSYDLYPTSGTADDYAWGLHRADTAMPKIHAFTVEFGREFQPAWTEMSKIIADLSAGIVSFALKGISLPRA